MNAINFIEAIKSVRTLGHNRYEVRQGTYGQVILEPVPAVCLKEAKDFVEDIMALGVARYLAAKSAEAEREFNLRCEQRQRNLVHPNDDIEF